MIWNCFMVGLGGFVGSILRYLVGLLPLDTGNGFPIKTFLINLIGAFLLGFLSVCLGKRVDLQPRVALFLKVGLCGGFTTFSTFAYESSSLVQDGHMGVALIYMIGSLVLGVLAALLGQWIAG